MSHCAYIPVCGHTADMREKSFMVGTKKELIKLVTADLYKRFFFTWGPSVCVERYFYEDACIVRLHLEGKPFFDAPVDKEKIWQEIEDMCEGVCQAMPFLSQEIGLDRREKIACDFKCPLPNIFALQKITVFTDEQRARTGATTKTDKKTGKKSSKKAGKPADTASQPVGPLGSQDDMPGFEAFMDAGFAWDGQDEEREKRLDDAWLFGGVLKKMQLSETERTFAAMAFSLMNLSLPYEIKERAALEALKVLTTKGRKAKKIKMMTLLGLSEEDASKLYDLITTLQKEEKTAKQASFDDMAA